jgi:branched-chain amino acid transport system substrate-binding protein
MRADPFGSCYYDAAMILADAMRKVGPDREKIRDYFAHVKDYKGVTRIYTTDSRGDMAHNVSLVKFAPGTKDISLVGYYPPQKS